MAEVATSPELVKLVECLADNKYFLGRRYAEWCTAAPALEAAVAAAAMAQDEIGHARSLYPLLQDLAGRSVQTEAETRTAFTNARFLDAPFASWTDFVAANFLFDTALTALLEASQQASLGALAQRARRMLEEEKLHWLHGEGWTRRLARSEPPVAAAFVDSLLRVWPEALETLAVADGSLVSQGILEIDGAALLGRYRERVNAVLAGLELPSLP